MAGSRGPEAWAKYYQGQGNIETTIKTDGLAFTEDGRPSGVSLARGTPVTVLAMTAYETRPRIMVKRNGTAQTFRFPLDSLVKPGKRSSGAASLKPQAFGVVGPALAPAVYKKRVLEVLEERTDLAGPVKSYLALLVDYWGGNDAAKPALVKLYAQVRDQVSVADVNKDFAEVLGPLAIVHRGVLDRVGLSRAITAQSSIYIPARPNEPLMDYKVGDLVISAKSGTPSNTVKPQDILMLLAKRPEILRQHQNTKEYKILQTLAERSVMEGPLPAIEILLGGERQYVDWSDSLAESPQYRYRGLPILEKIYLAEQYISKESKSGSLNYTNLFADAIHNSVVYVKFKLDASGLGQFEVIVADDFRKVATGARPWLRSKGRGSKERLGIQI